MNKNYCILISGIGLIMVLALLYLNPNAKSNYLFISMLWIGHIRFLKKFCSN